MSTEELIAEYLERMKDPDITKDAFNEYSRRVKELRSLVPEK